MRHTIIISEKRRLTGIQNYSYQPHGVCARQITFGIEDNKLHNVVFYGGCPGNSSAISRLLEGKEAAEAVAILKGNDCGGRGTSCADQLAVAVEQAFTHPNVNDRYIPIEDFQILSPGMIYLTSPQASSITGEKKS